MILNMFFSKIDNISTLVKSINEDTLDRKAKYEDSSYPFYYINGFSSVNLNILPTIGFLFWLHLNNITGIDR